MVAAKEVASLLKNGVFAINKVRDSSCADLLNRLKEVIRDGIEPDYRPYHLRLGHGGTLDRMAVGVLVVGVNSGCKILTPMLHGSKSYIVVGQLGIATDTYNETGKIIDERPYSHVRERDVKTALKCFVGDTLQAVPLYCTPKLVNTRSVEDFREDQDVPSKVRKVRCYSAEVTDFSPPFFTIQIHCGGGFYVRSLVHDLGRALNTCAYVRQLQRTQQGPFTLHDCLNESEFMSSKNIFDSILLCRLKLSNYVNRGVKTVS